MAEEMEFGPLRQASLTDLATERLTEFVLRAGARTGWCLPPEHELCAKLGVGRSTLREATKVLESRGLIKRVQGKGVQVIDRSREATAELLQLSLRRGAVSYEELFEVRTIFEVQAAALAAERATPEDLARMERELKVMQATDTRDEHYIDADLNFHVAVAAATHNRVLSLIVDTILPLLRDAIVATLHDEKRPEPRRRHHARIFNAIRAGDAAKASEAMARHLAAGKQMMKSLQKKTEQPESQ
ncbi:MAG: FadR family transcriptional regulator [Planctomycetes bacterium]|nr:FadR family transcriptional regulator [Planctomycetota bacterium]